jgi:transaldolase
VTISHQSDLRIKIFADGANLAAMKELSAKPHIKGLTTNPTLMRQSGVSDYESFAKEALALIPSKPISFEVFADTPSEMIRQAKLISGWAENVYVKVPISTTKGESCSVVIRELSAMGVKLNVTALMTVAQVHDVALNLEASVPAVVSVFAGRIADTGRDPVPIMRECGAVLSTLPEAELLWASPRELLNIVQADETGCNIITVTPDLLKKLEFIGKDLTEFSVETVRMFYRDAADAGYAI